MAQIWFRKEIEVPQSWAGRSLELNLAAIDDFDTTYFNGTKVGGTGSETPNSYNVPRHYKIPADLVQAGKNVIAVRVFDSAGEGGFGAGIMSLRPSEGSEEARLTCGSVELQSRTGIDSKESRLGFTSRSRRPNKSEQSQRSLQRDDRTSHTAFDSWRDLVPGREQCRACISVPDSLPNDDPQLAHRVGRG